MAANQTWLQKCSDDESGDHIYSESNHCRAIFYARTTSAVLSMVGCILVLFIILVYKKYRHFTQRLIMYLLLPTIVVSGVSVYPRINNTDVSCEVAGFFMNWGLLSQRLMILCIIIHLLVFTFQQNRPKRLELIFHVITWGFSLGFSLIPIPGHHYGSAGVWCWIKGNTTYEEDLRFGCFYLWVWCCILIEVVCFSLVVIRVRRQLKSFHGRSNPEIVAQRNRYKKYIYPLLLYPLVNIILAIPVTANRIQNWADKNDPLFGLFLCHSIVYPIWGFCNAMMYFINRETIQQLHPYAIWERLTSWRDHVSMQQANAPASPEIDCRYATDTAIANPAAFHSAIMESESDMD